MTEVAYCTREQVQGALNQADRYRENARVDSAIAAGANAVFSYTRRLFYPTTAVRYPDFRKQVQGAILWLDTSAYEALSITSFVSDDITYVEGTDFYLDPDDGPPYTSLRLYNTSSASFSANDRGLVLTGSFGSSNATRPAGALAGAISTTSATTLTVTDSGLVGVGDLLTVGSERMIVTDKQQASTTTTLTGNLTASAAARSVAVSDGTLIHAGELILIGTERMFVESITGNTLLVRRAENGSVLATHATSDVVYAPRLCTVTRGATGSTAATHSDAATVLANDPPPLVKEANLAFALVNLGQGKASYNQTTGSGDNARETGGRGLPQIVNDLIQAYGRVKLGMA
jgi:hypothetical protein